MKKFQITNLANKAISNSRMQSIGSTKVKQNYSLVHNTRRKIGIFDWSLQLKFSHKWHLQLKFH
jgi:hypothetical protein